MQMLHGRLAQTRRPVGLFFVFVATCLLVFSGQATMGRPHGSRHYDRSPYEGTRINTPRSARRPRGCAQRLQTFHLAEAITAQRISSVLRSARNAGADHTRSPPLTC